MTGHPAYPEYQETGVPWLGEIPSHWEVMRLKYAAPESSEKLSEKPEDLPYIGLENIESGTGRLLMEDLAENVESTVVKFNNGDVLFGKLRPYLAKVVHVDFKGVGTTELLVLQPSSDVVNRFIFYYLLSKGVIDTINSLTYGAKMPRANSEQVGNLPLPSPPLPEQRAIAAFLDERAARIDAATAEYRRLADLLHEQRAALISHAVTQGLDPNAPRKESGIEWLGEIPSHWKTYAIKRVATEIQTGSTPPTSERRYYQDGSAPWFGPSSFGNDLILEKPVKLINRTAIEEGVAKLYKKGSTLIITIGATLGKVGYLDFPASSNQQITAVTFKESYVHPKFASYQLKSFEPAMQGFAPNTTLPILNQQDISMLPVLLPALPEQRAITAYLDEQTNRIDAALDEIDAAIGHLEEYRAALIAAAVTGKIDVR